RLTAAGDLPVGQRRQRPPQSPAMNDEPRIWRGVVTHLHLAPAASVPMLAQHELELVAGEGVRGDRYRDGSGFYSSKPEIGRQIRLSEGERLDALNRDHDIVSAAAEHRRNVTTRGVPLNHLVGRRFRLGEAVLEATRLSIPCQHLVELTGKKVFK